MSEREQYLQHAAYCKRMATNAPLKNLENDWLGAAALWSLMASRIPVADGDGPSEIQTIGERRH
jgi:hypothetical protein